MVQKNPILGGLGPWTKGTALVMKRLKAIKLTDKSSDDEKKMF